AASSATAPIFQCIAVDRTTDGYGFAADLSLEQIRRLDAGSGRHLRFAGTPIPKLVEVLDWARHEEMGLFIEIKEGERPDLAVDGVAALLAETGTIGLVVLISFDHVVLKRALQRHPCIRTQAITHARHADILGVLRSCGASSVAIELDMFHPDDARILHAAGCSNRVSIPRPEQLAEYRGGRGAPLAVVGEWIADGLIDAVSGDDVPFMAQLSNAPARRAHRDGI